MFIVLRIVFVLNLICFVDDVCNNHIHANALSCFSEKEEKYNLSICAIFKNESKYLKEWIEYHRLVGVDHFYLYNNNSTDAFMNVLNPYLKEGLVTLVQWPDRLGPVDEDQIYKWALSTQISAYENVVKFRGLGETKWLICMGIDEFLVSPSEDRLVDLLKRYDEYPGVILKSNSFDASHASIDPTRKLIIQTVELIAQPSKNPQIEVARVIFKPEQCAGFTWPPYQCVFKNQQKPIVLRKSEIRMNYYANRFAGYLDSGKYRNKLHIDNRTLSELEVTELLDIGYEIEDRERVIYHFIPELMKRLGYETWPSW